MFEGSKEASGTRAIADNPEALATRTSKVQQAREVLEDILEIALQGNDSLPQLNLLLPGNCHLTMESRHLPARTW